MDQKIKEVSFVSAPGLNKGLKDKDETNSYSIYKSKEKTH